MILCDFDDLNKEDFHLKFFEAVVQGNIEIVKELLQHSKLSKQLDITFRNHHCIIASILNSQQVNDCHLELLQLFTESSLLKKHANPSLCITADIFGGAFGNAIIFTPIETVRFIGKFFNEKTANLQDLIALSALNNRKEAFFYLVEERKFVIQKPDLISKALVKFPHVSEEIVQYISKLLTQPSVEKEDKNNNKKDNVPTLPSKRKSAQSQLLNLSYMKETSPSNYWGSKFRQNF